jgi:hypothetical protein
MVFRDSLSWVSTTLGHQPAFSRIQRMGYKLLLVIIIFMVAITLVVSTVHMDFI